METLNPWTVHQYINTRQNAVSVLCVPLSLGQLIPGVTRIHPNALLWVGSSDLLDKLNKTFLVFWLKRLSTKDGKTVDIDRCKRVNNLLLNFWSKLSAALEIPRLLSKAAFTVQTAA